MTDTNELPIGQFCERLGFKPSYGTQLKKEGRLVLTPDGKRVLVAESIARIESTRDPSKAGVAARHAAHRGGPVGLPGPVVPPLDDDDDGADLTGQARYDYQSAKAQKEHWNAQRAELEFRREAGLLIEVSELNRALAETGALVRGRLEGWAATLAPRLAGRDEAAIRNSLADEVETLLRDMAQQARNQAEAITKEVNARNA